jgi:hypothetical protein
MIDWSAFAKHYLETGEWNGPGYAPLDPRTDCPLHVREALGIETDPDLAKPRRANGHAPETNTESPPPQPEQPSTGSVTGSEHDDGYTAQIIAAMTAASIELPPTAIIADGKIHRFVSKSGTQKKNGWYVVHPGPVIPTWTFGDWSVPDLKKQHGKGKPGRELSPEEQAAFEERRREQEEKVRAERDRAWKDAAIEAEQRWKKAKLPRRVTPI